MWDVMDWMRGELRHMKRIGQHEEHRRLAKRNEERLAELRKAGRLTESRECCNENHGERR